MNGGIDTLPGVADMTAAGNGAGAVFTAAFGDGEGAFQRIEYGCGGDLAGGFGQLITTMTAAPRTDQASLIEFLQQLADRSGAQMRQLRQFGGGIQTLIASGQAGQNHGGVVGQFADA